MPTACSPCSCIIAFPWAGQLECARRSREFRRFGETTVKFSLRLWRAGTREMAVRRAATPFPMVRACHPGDLIRENTSRVLRVKCPGRWERPGHWLARLARLVSLVGILAISHVARAQPVPLITDEPNSDK